MPKYLADIGQRCSRAQHLCRRGVPQPVRVDLAQASTPAAVKDNHRHATGRQRPVWRFDPHEHTPPLRRDGSPAAQVADDRGTHVGG